jgi:hypothetical protein
MIPSPVTNSLIHATRRVLSPGKDEPFCDALRRPALLALLPPEGKKQVDVVVRNWRANERTVDQPQSPANPDLSCSVELSSSCILSTAKHGISEVRPGTGYKSMVNGWLTLSFEARISPSILRLSFAIQVEAICSSF